MTVLFQCPKCQANLKAPSDRIGARSRCNRCATPVVVPDPDAAPAAVAPKSPVQTVQEVLSEGIPAEPEDDVTRAAPLIRALQGIWRFVDTILDIRFKRYLTPYIVKAAWVLLILCCIGGFVLSRFAMPVIEALEERAVHAALKNRLESPPTYEWRTYRRVEPNPVADWIAGTILYVFSSVFLLLFARVAGESIIVVFNISTDLKAIKQNQTGP